MKSLESMRCIFYLKRQKIYKGRDYDPKQELLTLWSSEMAYTFHKITSVESQFHFNSLHIWNSRFAMLEGIERKKGIGITRVEIHVWWLKAFLYIKNDGTESVSVRYFHAFGLKMNFYSANKYVLKFNNRNIKKYVKYVQSLLVKSFRCLYC